MAGGGVTAGFQSAFGIGVTGRYPMIRSNAVAADPAGDTIITGSFRGTVSFDPHSAAATFTSAGTEDAFVAEYSPAGSLLWARTFAGRATTTPQGTTYAVGQGSALAVDRAGNVFVAGSFNGQVDFGAGPIGAAGPVGNEAFAAKLDPSGNLAWVDAVGGGSDDTDESYALALDGSGGVIFAGSFQGSATFGPDTLRATGASDAFAARVDGGGRFLWAVADQGGALSTTAILGAAVDGSGNVALAGFFSGAVHFPGGVAADRASAGSNDALIWKLDPAGRTLWARSFGGPDYDAATAIAVDPAGNIYATGGFSGTVNFGTGPSTDYRTSGPIFDGFVLKLDPGGNEAWADGLVDPAGWSKGAGIAVDPDGLVHVAGTFSRTVQIAPEAGGATLSSGGSADVLLAGFDGGGRPIYALQAGRTNFNAALGLTIVGPGTLAITGTDTGPIDFGPVTVPSAGMGNVYVARATIQLQRPDAPSSPVLEAASDTGSSPSDGITSARSPILDVASAVSSNIVKLLRDGVVVASRVGPGAIRDPGPVPDGTHSYTALQVDSRGFAGPASPASSVTILTATPAAPAATALLAADDTGTVGDGLTAVRQPRLTGIAPPFASVEIVDPSGSAIARAVAGPDGSYAAKPQAGLVDGIYTLAARVVDVAGNIGTASPSITLTIDGTPPTAPGRPGLTLADDSGTAGDGLTNVRQPRLSGVAEPGSSVQLLDPSGRVDATASAAANGSYTARVAGLLADGLYLLHAVATDAAGNVSPDGPAFGLVIDATAPAVPGRPVLVAQDDTGAVGDGITAARQPRLTGSAAPGVTVQIVNAAGAVLGTATATAAGAYTIAPSGPLADGSYAIRAIAVDAAANVSTPGDPATLAILATPPPAPPAPTLMAADDTGGVGDGVTSVKRPRLVGTAAPGGRADWIAADGSVLASSPVSADGSYQIQAPTALANGIRSVRIRSTDVAGNVGPTGPAFHLTVRATVADYFGTGATPLHDYQPGIATYSIQQPITGALIWKPFGTVGDVPVSGDFFGDGRGDLAVYRPGTSTFYALDPATNVSMAVALGQAGDLPVPADFTGDGKTDAAVYRPGTSTFLVRDSATNAVTSRPFGLPGDIPVPADYFGDGHADFAVYRPSMATFFVLNPATGATATVPLGQPGDIPTPADFEALGRVDFAVYRPSTATYYVKMSATGSVTVKRFGLVGDIPVPADYFGDGHADVAVFRPSTATYFVFNLATSRGKIAQWGYAGRDRPTLAPLATWFQATTLTKSSPIGSPSAASASGGPSAPALGRGSVPTVTEFVPDSSVPGRSAKPKAIHDLAIRNLGQGRWRPGR